MPRRGRDELFFAGEFKLDRAAGLDGGECENILDEHFLLAAEAAADALAKHPDPVRRETKKLRQRAVRQERHLRAGAYVQDAGGIDPGEAAMGFQSGVLDTLRRERSLVGSSGLREGGSDIAELTVGLRHDVALPVCDPLLRRLVAVDQGRAWCNRRGWIEHIRQNVVIDREAAAALFGSGFRLGDDGGYLLSDETDDIVQHAGVVRVHPGPLVPRRGEQ